MRVLFPLGLCVFYINLCVFPVAALATQPVSTSNPFNSGNVLSSPTIAAPTSKPAKQSRQYLSSPEYGDEYYTNVDGHYVHRPVESKGRPPGAHYHCRDGKWSFSEHRRGACNRHGGVE